jgi:hypothetical protein
MNVYNQLWIGNRMCWTPLSLSLSLCGSTATLALGRFFSFLILHTVGSTPWTGDEPVIEHLQNVITNNSCATANSHTLQFTTARTTTSKSAESSQMSPCNGF